MAENETVAGTLGDVVKNQEPLPQDAASVLRAAYNKAKSTAEIKDMIVPGYGEPESELHVTFHTLPDYKEVRERLKALAKRKELRTDAQKEIAIALETMALAAEGSYAIVGGQKVGIGEKIGLPLYNYLFPDGNGSVEPQNDAQAITLIYRNHTTRIMAAATQLDQWIQFGGNDEEAVDEVLGESQAG